MGVLIYWTDFKWLFLTNWCCALMPNSTSFTFPSINACGMPPKRRLGFTALKHSELVWKAYILSNIWRTPSINSFNLWVSSFNRYLLAVWTCSVWMVGRELPRILYCCVIASRYFSGHFYINFFTKCIARFRTFVKLRMDKMEKNHADRCQNT